MLRRISLTTYRKCGGGFAKTGRAAPCPAPSRRTTGRALPCPRAKRVFPLPQRRGVPRCTKVS
ncbi:MAG: hypothetical protein LBM98_13040 [Oscillospiraceae bacterium]|nr:hypothetical protein [Oscillospiraceae bacterium]